MLPCQSPRVIRFLNIRQSVPDADHGPEAMAQARRHVQFSAFVPGVLVVLLWMIHALAWTLGSDWSFLGVYPRNWSMIWHIGTAPLVHGDWAHLAANSLPLFVLGFLLLYSYKKVAFPTLLLIWLLSGLGVWLLGRPAWHIGASGVVFGINFFLFFSGLFRMDMRSLALSLLVAFAYGGMVWGVFPTDPHISFEAHASGAAIGAILAYAFRNIDRPPEHVWDEDDEELVHNQNAGPRPAQHAPSKAVDAAALHSAHRPRVIRLRYHPPANQSPGSSATGTGTPSSRTPGGRT